MIYVNGLVNKLFNIQFNYESNEVSLLDALNINIDIYLERTEILLNIEKIILHFPNDKYTKERHIKTFEYIASKLEGYTNLVAYGFVDIYPKLEKIHPEIKDTDDDTKIELTKAFLDIANHHFL